MQLDGAAHGHDALRDLGRIALHPGVGQLRSRSMLRRMSRCWCLNLSMFTEGLLG
jgi:hypothetical protein